MPDIVPLPADYADWLAEYALRDTAQPIGIAEYQLIEALPAELRTSLPSLAQIKQALADDGHADEEPN